MLKWLRENLRSFSWLLWVIIIVFVALLFADVGVLSSSDETGRTAKAAFSKGSDEIVVTFEEYEQAYRNLENYQRQLFQGNIPDAFRERLRLEALNQAVNQKVMLAEARRMGLEVSDAELRETILGYPVFTDENGKFVGQEQYRQLVNRMGMPTAKAFEDAVREDLLSEKIDRVLRETAFVSDQEVEASYRQQVERVSLKYLALPDRQFADTVEVTPAEVQAHFEAHKEEYRLPEQRRIAYLLVDTGALRSKMEVSPEQIETFYQANSADYQQDEEVRARHILIKTDERTPEEAEAEIARIRARIQGGEPFEKVARESSEDPGSAQMGGDLRFFPRGRMTPAFEEAAFNAKVGELVGPVRTPFGAHLIEVTARREAGLRPLEEVRAQVRHRLLTEQVDKEAERLAGQMLAKLKESGKPTLETLHAFPATMEGVSFVETEPFGSEDMIPGIGRSEDFSSAAFSLKTGDLSGLVKVPRGWAVLMLKEELEPRLPNLAEVEAKVRQAARVAEQRNLVRLRLVGAKAALSNGKTLEEVAAELGVEIKESADLGRTGSIAELGGASGKLIEDALDLGVGKVGGPVDYAQGAAIYQVTDHKGMDAAEFQRQKDATRQNLEARAYQRLRASLLEQRKLELGIQYAEQLAQAAQPRTPEAP